MDVEVTVINDSNVVGYLASVFRADEIYMKDVASMVDNVLSSLRGASRVCAPGLPKYVNKLARLNILDHGNPSGVEIGSDWINTSTFPRFASTLSRLYGHFSPVGFVHLQHCQVGQNQALLVAFAKTFGVPVFAGTGSQNPVYRINFGDYVRADPSGAYTKASRP
jgi:hypothetical protein